MKILAVLLIFGLLPLMAWVIQRVNRLSEKLDSLEEGWKQRAEGVEEERRALKEKREAAEAAELARRKKAKEAK
jgi:biopolymer transport protein ExbB/TolQ